MPYNSTVRSMLEAGLRSAQAGITKAANAAMEAGDEGTANTLLQAHLVVHDTLMWSLERKPPKVSRGQSQIEALTGASDSRDVTDQPT